MNAKQKKIFLQIKQKAKYSKKQLVILKGKLLYSVLKEFPPHLNNKKAEKDLSTIYEAYFHCNTQSVLICNKGASLLTKSPFTQTESCVYHIGFVIINEQQGIEIVNAGISGDITKSKTIVFRAESACAPSFVFGSQRCNCYDQWLVLRELAARMNKCKLPRAALEEHENLISNYMKKNEEGLPVPFKKGQAFLMIHLDSQNGMGSGANQNIFSHELTATAFLRHRGEYTAEQVHKTTMAGGFRTIGLTPDPRKFNNNFGYKIPTIILDYFKIDKPLIILTNNKDKIREIKKARYRFFRILFVGRANEHSSLETRDRILEFDHMIPLNYEISPEKEVKLIEKEIQKINKGLK